MTFIADRQALGVATGWRSRLLVVAPVPVRVAPETLLLLPSLNERRLSSEEAPRLGGLSAQQSLSAARVV